MRRACLPSDAALRILLVTGLAAAIPSTVSYVGSRRPPRSTVLAGNTYPGVPVYPRLLSGHLRASGTLVLSVIIRCSIARNTSKRAAVRPFPHGSDDSRLSVRVGDHSAREKLSDPGGKTLFDLIEIAIARALGHWLPRD